MLARRRSYQTNSFMIIPLTGYKFWGVINLADRQDGLPFGARDLFLGWLLGRLLVEILGYPASPRMRSIDLPLSAPWISKELPVGVAFLDASLTIVHSNPP